MKHGVLALGLLAMSAHSGCRQYDGDDRHSADDGAPHVDDPATGKLKPYAVVNRQLGERLFGSDSTLSLSGYIQDPAPPDDPLAALGPSLVDLLGGYQGDGLRNDLRNATPNSVNMILWYMTLDGLAQDLAQVCVPDGSTDKFALVDLRSDVSETIARFCVESAAGVLSEDTLSRFWRQVMHADSTDEEYGAWRAQVQTTVAGAVNAMEPFESARAAFMAMTYNPHFMLMK